MNKSFLLLITALILACSGCEDSAYTGAPPVADDTATSRVKVDTDRVDVDIKTNESASPDRVERRLERRENLRDAIDNVDVDVDAGRTNVDVR